MATEQINNLGIDVATLGRIIYSDYEQSTDIQNAAPNYQNHSTTKLIKRNGLSLLVTHVAWFSMQDRLDDILRSSPPTHPNPWRLSQTQISFSPLSETWKVAGTDDDPKEVLGQRSDRVYVPSFYFKQTGDREKYLHDMTLIKMFWQS